jgi:alkylation response protein AidB-like acyl-CoA dehydrogenase
MNFDFSEEQYSFRESVRSYLSDRRAAPAIVAESECAANSVELCKGLADLGIYAILVPVEYEGLGLSWVDLTLPLEELGAHIVPASIIDTLVATDVIARCGSPQQMARLLPGIARGELRVAIACQEEGAGYGLADIATRLDNSGERLTLDGGKIMAADAHSADLLLVVARTASNGGESVVLVDQKRDGVELLQQQTLDLSTRYDRVMLRDVKIEPADIIRGTGKSFAALRLLNASAFAAAAFLAGIGGAVFERSIQYVKERQQFGRPIGSFQVIKHRCADMAVALEATRSAVYYAAWALANDAPDSEKAVSIAKSYSGDTARFICNEGTQLHGGMGFTWDLGLHFYLRRAKLLEYCYGDATFHRKRLLKASLAEQGLAHRAISATP